MNPDVNKKRMHQLLYDTDSLFLILYQVFSFNLFESDVHCALKTRLFQQVFFKLLKLL